MIGKAAKPIQGLLLIDVQLAFLPNGCWANCFEKGQTDPIVKAFDNIYKRANQLFDNQTFKCVALTKCYLNAPDGEYPDFLKSIVKNNNYLFFHKHDTDATENPFFCEFMHNSIYEKNMNRLVIGGCTTTSCIRVSSSQIA